MNILILCGGDSPEREISLKSGSAVAEAFRSLAHKVTVFDPIEGVQAVTNKLRDADVVLPILHGKNGEDGSLQRIFEDAGTKYLGSDSKVSAITFDKVRTHEVLSGAPIRMPQYETVSLDTFKESVLIKNPFVLKPVSGGSSLDTVIATVVNKEIYDRCEEILTKYDNMLLEELVVGLEITVPILGEEPLPVIAIIPPENKVFDYENKYNGQTKELCPVPDDLLTQELQGQAQKLALDVHRLLGARHLSRTDIIVADDGTMYVLELNTMPGMTTQSLFPKSAQCAGLTMQELVEKLVTLAGGEA